MRQVVRERLAGLDTLRAVAILAVMAFHLNQRLPQAFEVAGHFGWMGVDLFFVLSGYLIGAQLLRPVRQGESLAVMTFYRNRVYRILPAYLVVLAVYVTWPGWREDTGMSPLWEFLTFTENLFVDYGKNHAFSHVWSLCVEEHFYLLLPVIVRMLTRKASFKKTAVVVGAVLLFGVAIRSYELLRVLRRLNVESDDYGVTYIEKVYYPTYARLDGLLAGVSLALVKIFRPEWWEWLARRANRLLVVGSGLVGCAVWMFFDRFSSSTGVTAMSTVIGFPILSLGLALWIPGAADARCWLGRWHVPGMRVIAMLAFSLYLTHKAVAHMVHDLWPRVMNARDWRCVLVYAGSCLVVAAALYYGVERPFLRLRDRRGGRGVAAVDVEARAEPAL